MCDYCGYLRRDDPEALLTEAEVAARLGVPQQTVETWRQRGRGPAFLRIGKYVRYSPADLEAWIATRRNAPKGA